MNRELGYRMLIKKVKGKVTKIYYDDRRYWPKKNYVLTIDCIGTQGTCYIDGVKIFTWEDSDLPNGCIGLYCWKNPSSFIDVRVATPVWVPYYTFQKDQLLAAGTRIKIYAGNEKQTLVSPMEPGVIRRFIESSSECGKIRLNEHDTVLRLIDPGGKAGRTRSFLPEKTYDTLNTTILRNADGTAFFLFPSPGQDFKVGQYRLNLTYHRNNKAADPGSQVFSEAGNNQDESVTIDVPWEVQLVEL